MQGGVLRVKGHFDWLEATLADSRPQNVKNVLKMGFFGKTPGVNGLKEYFKECKNKKIYIDCIYQEISERIISGLPPWPS